MATETSSRTARTFLQATFGALGVAAAAVPLLHLPALRSAELAGGVAAAVTFVTFVQNLLEEFGKFPNLRRESPAQIAVDVEQAVEAALQDSGGIQALTEAVAALEAALREAGALADNVVASQTTAL